MEIALQEIWTIQPSIVKMRRAKLEGRNHFLMVLLLKKLAALLDAAQDSRRAIYDRNATKEEKATGIDIQPASTNYRKSVDEFEKVLDEKVTIADHKTINLSLEDAQTLEIGVLQDFDPFIDVAGMKTGKKQPKKGKTAKE